MLKDLKLRFLDFYGHRAVLEALFYCQSTTVTPEIFNWIKQRYGDLGAIAKLEREYRLLLDRYPCDYVAEASKIVLCGRQLTRSCQLEEIEKCIIHKLANRPIDLLSILTRE